MNTGLTDCTRLANDVCYFLPDWQVAGMSESEPCTWAAKIKRADGLVLFITESDKRGHNKPAVSVSFDFKASLNGLNEDYVSYADDDTKPTICRPDIQSVIAAIKEMLPAVEATYFRLKTKCEERERMAQHCKQVLAELATRIGEKVRYPYGLNDSYKNASVVYDRRGLRLEMEYTGYEKSFHLKGHCNYIPVDLMRRLIPVIEQWAREPADS